MALSWKKFKKGVAEMSFLEHLEELRWHIIRSILAILVFMIVAFMFKNLIFDTIILAPRNPAFITNRLLCSLGQLVNTSILCINSNDFELINIKMSGQLTTHIAVAMVSGVILAFPIILWEFWSFLKPALHSNEAKHTRGAVSSATLLFFAGVLFGYFLLTPLSIHFLSNYEVSSDVTNQINIRSYIGTLSSICLATGLIFELPIITFFLTKVGIVTPGFMRKYRKHSIVVIVVLSAIITPPDVFSQILVCFPLLALYEISIVISKRVLINKEKMHAEFMEEDTSVVNENKTK